MVQSKDASPALDRAVVGVNTTENMVARANFVSIIQDKVPSFGALAEQAEKIKNDSVASFTKEVVELLDSTPDLKIHNLKPNVASLLYPPVNLTDRDQLMGLVRSTYGFELLSFGSGHVSVAPPLNPNIYEVLRKNFKSKIYLAKLANVDISVWYKYEAAKVIPSSNTWGLLLLTAGIHPVYKLALRDDADKFRESQFAQLLTEHCMVRFPSTSNADENDLRSLAQASSDVVAYNKEDAESISASRILAKVKGCGVSLEPVYKAIGLKNGEKVVRNLSKKEFKALTDAIKDTVNVNLAKFPSATYDQNISWERAILMAVLEADLSSELLEEFSKYTRNVQIATRMYIEAPNNPNVYTAMKHLLTNTDNVAAFYRLVGVDIGMWFRLESGTRNLSTSLWSTILLVLNLHPFYKLKMRKDVTNSVPGRIFMASHKVVVDEPKTQNLTPETFPLIK